MKENAGKVLYLLLLLSAGVCLMIGAVINVKKQSSLLVIFGGLAIGLGMVIMAVQGFVRIIKSR